jgi:hypothetical protein
MSNDNPQASASFRAQWIEPSDIFSVLLILGGDVIQLALAALAGGSPPITPVAFSFGWVAYAVSAVLSAVGDNHLIQCAPEVSVQVFNLESGYGRSNRSWLLARLFKTYSYWMPQEVKMTLREPTHYRAALVGADPDVETGRPSCASLCVSLYQWSEPKGTEWSKVGVPVRDRLWWSGFVTVAVQLGIAAVPFGLYNDWSVFLVTVSGNFLALASGALPQWREEKWQARRKKAKPVALTMGNGTSHVVIVMGSEHGLDLEDLAGARADKPDTNMGSTQKMTFVLGVLWLALLVTSTGIKTHTWFLLAVGGLGMLQNLVVAGAPRRPEAMGLPIELVKNAEVPQIYAEEKVMWTLMKLEMDHQKFGKTLLPEFFPGELKKWEQEWWDSSNVEQRQSLLRENQHKYYVQHPLEK